MKDLMGLMKQAKDMQAKMEAAQNKIADIEAEGKAGGLVRVTLSGEGNMKSLKIDPSLMNYAEIVEDLIVAAYQDAKVKLDEAKDKMMTAAFDGMKMPF